MQNQASQVPHLPRTLSRARANIDAGAVSAGPVMHKNDRKLASRASRTLIWIVPGRGCCPGGPIHAASLGGGQYPIVVPRRRLARHRCRSVVRRGGRLVRLGGGGGRTGRGYSRPPRCRRQAGSGPRGPGMSSVWSGQKREREREDHLIRIARYCVAVR